MLSNYSELSVKGTELSFVKYNNNCVMKAQNVMAIREERVSLL